MSKVIRFKPPGKNRQAMREQACLWVVRLSAGLTETELQEIHAWLNEDPEHLKALLDAAATWDKVSVLSELSDIFPLKGYLAPRPAWPRCLAYSAVAVFVLLFYFQGPILGWLDEARFGVAAETIPISYETRIGEQSTVALPDGSVVILNTNSLIEVAFTKASRDIILHRGEGLFTVAKNAARPFRVHASGGVVEAVGTAFTMQQSVLEGLEVTVLEGEVSFTPAKQAALTVPPAQGAAAPAPAVPLAATAAIPLTAGESVEVKEEAEVIQKQKIQPNELESRLAWRHGMLLFQGEPLESVIQEVSRYTPIRIDVDDAVRDIQVVGYFRTGNIEGILLTMQDTFHIKVERLSDDHIVLRSSN